MRNIQKTTAIILVFFLSVGLLITPIQSNAADLQSAVGAVTTAGGNLYVRSTPSTSGIILSSLKKGSYVSLIQRSGSWWKVEYQENRYGYCHADYITPVEGTPVQVNTGGNVLNVRSGPGTTYSRITTLKNGSFVMLRSTTNGWSRILFHGTKLGYVSSQYLSAENSNSSTGLLSLNVPNFKQTDSRWSSYPLGTQGGNIGSIGCAVTGIAMLESYRTDTTIYPDAMAKKLNFTAGGGVYWPGHFTAVTSKTGYLDRIYALLAEGKPVLFGSTTSSGRQHWVVITGFSGGEKTAINFTIHDPGSFSRYTLQQHLDHFPNFYKFFYY